MGYASKKLNTENGHGPLKRAQVVVKWLCNLLLLPITALVKTAGWLINHAGQWWKDRKLKNLLYGLPALALAGFAIYFVLGHRMSSRFTRAAKYAAAGEQALREENWGVANLYLGRAIEMGVDNNETRFQLAKAAEKSNDGPRMVAILESLAPDDRAVYTPAHLWRALSILQKNPVVPTEVQVAEKQLTLALELDPGNPMANGLLGDMYYQSRLFDAAIQHLGKTSIQQPRYRLMLAKIWQAKGNAEKSFSHAREAEQGAEIQCVQNPRDIGKRLIYAESVLLQQRYRECIEILSVGLQQADDPGLRNALSMALVDWSDNLLAESPNNRGAAFELIAKSLENTPNDSLIFDRLMQMLKADAQDDVSEKIKTFLRKNIALGRATGVSHLILGTALFESGDSENAGFHYRKAFELTPAAPLIANNFAWYLLKSSPPAPEQALQIMNAIIKEKPVGPEYRDTRAHIYLELGQWEQAITDFESTLPQLTTRIETHEGLQKAYTNLEMTELADQHQRLAETLREQASSPDQ